MAAIANKRNDDMIVMFHDRLFLFHNSIEVAAKHYFVTKENNNEKEYGRR
jgi:hypothetical protein